MTDRPNPRILPARVVAAEVLAHADPRQRPIGEALEKGLLRTQETQRCTDLVLGTLRNHTAIDAVIQAFGGCPVRRIQRRLLAVIRVASYELAYCPQTPEHAIVNEAVGAVRRSHGPRQAGFVNAVLRQILRHITSRRMSMAGARPEAALPQTGDVGCGFDPAFLPAPDSGVGEHLMVCFSMPKWLVEGWLSQFGPDRTRSICLASNRRPSLYLRPNPLQVQVSALADRFRREGFEIEVSGEGLLRMAGAGAVDRMPGFSHGLFTVQDLSASRVVGHMAPRPGESILDLCAAPGGKTTQIAEASMEQARVVATDIDAHRLSKVQENVKRLGLGCITILQPRHLPGYVQQHGLFDAVLLDVPCSNTGVMARRIEVRFRLTQDAIEELARVQSRLLDQAAAWTKPGGRIVYSTCSIQSSENQDRVRQFLAGHGEFRLETEDLMVPATGPFDHDGGFLAVLRRD